MICNLPKRLFLGFLFISLLNLMACASGKTQLPETTDIPIVNTPESVNQNLVLATNTPEAVSNQTEVIAPNNLEVVYGKSGNLWILIKGALFQLTDSGRDSDPRISKDNQLISFTRGGELWVMDLAGGNQRKVFGHTGQGLFQFEFISNTHKIIFSTTGSDGQPRLDLNVVDADQGQVQGLLAVGEGGEFTPSPDWKTLALVQQGKLISYSIESQKPIVVYQFQPLKGQNMDHFVPISWLEDGNGFNTVIPAANGKPALFLFIPISGGNTGQLAELSPVSPLESETLLSPDGSKILYLKSQAENLEMHVVDASTADRTYLRKPTGEMGLIGWEPDSTNMLFWVNDPRYVYFTDGVKVTRLSETITASVDNILWLDMEHCLVISDSNLLFVVPGQLAKMIDHGAAKLFDGLFLR